MWQFERFLFLFHKNFQYFILYLLFSLKNIYLFSL
nr:MAG TPA: hypothetical protein [Caudoviricetes sp.]